MRVCARAREAGGGRVAKASEHGCSLSRHPLCPTCPPFPRSPTRPPALQIEVPSQGDSLKSLLAPLAVLGLWAFNYVVFMR